MYFSSMTPLFLLLSASKRGTILLIAARMSAWDFKRFLDFILIDKKVLNPDSHGYVVAYMSVERIFSVRGQ